MIKARVALVQFDSEPLNIEKTLKDMARIVEQASYSGARWILFHEGCIGDYGPDPEQFAEEVPSGRSTQILSDLAVRYSCYISFGISERELNRLFISQVFVGPHGFFYRYRKTWLWREPEDIGYRNEWARYDPGTGPELFIIDGVNATCFICADGESARCISRAKLLGPQVVFYPNNRVTLPEYYDLGQLAKDIQSPLLVANRTGKSWVYDCEGGSAIFSSRGDILAQANRNGFEEILICDLEIV